MRPLNRLTTIGLLLATAGILAACSTVGDVMPVGTDTYTVASQKGGQFWTLGPSWSDVKALSITRANEFCTAKGKQMQVIGWDTHGARGFSQLNAELTFTCGGSLEKKSALVNPGDKKEQVVSVMGLPQDRQFRDKNEVWQYCITGAGSGYHDYRMFWFYEGQVTGITSYKDSTPASSCQGHFKAVNWEETPDTTIEIRNR